MSLVSYLGVLFVVKIRDCDKRSLCCLMNSWKRTLVARKLINWTQASKKANHDQLAFQRISTSYVDHQMNDFKWKPVVD